MEQKQKDMLMKSMHRIKKLRPWPPTFAGISKGEFFMLHTIIHLTHKKDDDNPGVKISVLCEKTEMSKPAASQMLNSLEDKGLVERIVTKSDRRVVYVTLTEEGKKVLDQAALHMTNLVEKVVERLGPEDTKELTRLFDKLYTIIDELKESESGN